jgi:primosomal protein N'
VLILREEEELQLSATQNFTGIKTALPIKKFVFAWCDFSGKTEIYIKLIEVPYYRKTSLVFVA